MKYTFVVPVDGSSSARNALEYAIQIANAIKAEIVLMNVQPSFSHSPNVKKFFDEQEIREYQLQNGQEVLTPAEQLLEQNSIPYTSIIRTGDPGVEICNEAKERGAMGIIMGSRGMGPIRGMILGSVSYSVLHNAPCPVTIV